jgi:hypothetical protein
VIVSVSPPAQSALEGSTSATTGSGGVISSPAVRIASSPAEFSISRSEWPSGRSAGAVASNSTLEAVHSTFDSTIEGSLATMVLAESKPEPCTRKVRVAPRTTRNGYSSATRPALIATSAASSTRARLVLLCLVHLEGPEMRRAEVDVHRELGGHVEARDGAVERRGIELVRARVQAAEDEVSVVVGEHGCDRSPRGCASDDMRAADRASGTRVLEMAHDRGTHRIRVDLAQSAHFVEREAPVEEDRRIDVGVHRPARPAGVIEAEEVPELVRADVLDVEATRLLRGREVEALPVEEHVGVRDAATREEVHGRHGDDPRALRK